MKEVLMEFCPQQATDYDDAPSEIYAGGGAGPFENVL
jgi:hypothetical protein